MHLKKKLVDSVNCCPVLCVCFFLVCVSHLCVISYVCGNGWAGWSSSCTLDTHTPPAETLTSPTLQFTHTQTEKEKWKLIEKTCRRTYTEQKERLWDGGRERERGSIISMFYVSLWEATFRAWMGSCHAASREHLRQPDMNTGPCDRINYCELKALPCDVPPSALPCHMSGVLLSPSSLSPCLLPSRTRCSFPARRSSYVSPRPHRGGITQTRVRRWRTRWSNRNGCGT